MAPTPRSRRQRGQEDEEERTPYRRAKPSPMMPMLGLLALVVLVGGAIVVGRMAQKSAKQGEVDAGPALVDGYVPFSNVPKETAPAPRGGSGETKKRRSWEEPAYDPSKYTPAPAGLLDESLWIDALAVAEKAKVLDQKALTARQANLSQAFTTDGKAAQKTFDEAFTMTAAWEMELVEKHGERDPQVRQIRRVREEWNDRRLWYHKSIGR